MKWFGFSLTFVGAFIVANYRIFSKKILNRGKGLDERPSVVVLNTGASLVCVMTLMFIFLITGAKANIAEGFYKYVIISGILNVFIGLLNFSALQKEKASLVVPIFDTTPAVIVFTSMLFANEKLSLLGYIGILFLVLGTYTLNIHILIEELYNNNWSIGAFFAPFRVLSQSKGVRHAFYASLLGCISLPFDGLAARSANPFLAVACIMSFPAITSFSLSLYLKQSNQFFDSKKAMPHASLVGVLYGLAVGAYSWSFNYILISYQATFKRVETLMVLGLAYFILKEHKNFKERLLAVLLIIVGSVFIMRN